MQQQHRPLTEAERRLASAWKAFPHCDAIRIAEALDNGSRPQCPRCDAPLTAAPATRLRTAVSPGSYDLECGGCRRYHAVIPQVDEQLYFVRLKRLATAVLQA
jgi:hypothetical protein